MGRTGDVARAVADLADALHQVDSRLRVRQGRADARADAVIHTPDGQELVVELKVAKRPTPASVGVLIASTPRAAGSVTVMVADSLMPAVRALLKDAGWSWLDRGGHLRFWTGSLMVDTPVVSLLAELPGAPPLNKPASQELALLLLAEAGPVGVRAAAGLLERSPSTISGGLRALREASLVEADGTPVVPELFWALAGEWGGRVRPVALADRPHPDDAGRTGQLQLGLRRPEETTGWALRGAVAASAWGAKAPVPGGYPPDFFVPDDRTVRVAVQLFGRALEHTERGCTVAVAPTPWIVRHRVDLCGRSLADTPWPAAHPVVVALDLAQDPRGRETLEDFDPPPGWCRVW